MSREDRKIEEITREQAIKKFGESEFYWEGHKIIIPDEGYYIIKENI